MYTYILRYKYKDFDGKIEIGQCEVKASTMFHAIYEFYCSHGLKYEVTGWGIKKKEDD